MFLPLQTTLLTTLNIQLSCKKKMNGKKIRRYTNVGAISLAYYDNIVKASQCNGQGEWATLATSLEREYAHKRCPETTWKHYKSHWAVNSAECGYFSAVFSSACGIMSVGQVVAPAGVISSLRDGFMFRRWLKKNC